MSQKPVHLTSSARKPSGRQSVWEAIRKNRDGFTSISLSQATKIERGTLKTYVSGLEKAGFIERIGTELPQSGILGTEAKTQFQKVVYRLINDVGVTAPRVTKDGQPVIQGLIQEQLWRTMRMTSTDWNKRELSVMASTDEVAVSESDAHDYIKHLNAAGYLKVTAKNKGRYSLARYRLIKNTGPRAPMIQRIKTVFDPNLCKIVWHEEVCE